MENLFDKYFKVIEEIKNNENVDSLILFGSYSQNKQKKLSDLDLAVLFKPDTSQKEKTKVLSNGSEELDLTDFNELPLPLQYKIVFYGRVLKNQEKINAIKFKIKNQYLDFIPYLKRSAKRRNLPLKIHL